MTSAPHSSNFATNVCGSEPSRQLPSSSMVTCATRGIDALTSRTASMAWWTSSRYPKVSRISRSTPLSTSTSICCAEGISGLLKRRLAQRFDSGAQRANRSRYPHIEAFGGFAGQACSGAIHVGHLVRQAVSSQTERVSTESISFDNFGSSLKVIVVNSTNHFGLGKIQFIVRPVDEDAFGIEQRPHRAIAQHGGLLNPGKKVSRHIDSENTGSTLVRAS